jgi:hypothetical protein
MLSLAACQTNLGVTDAVTCQVPQPCSCSKKVYLFTHTKKSIPEFGDGLKQGINWEDILLG